MANLRILVGVLRDLTERRSPQERAAVALSRLVFRQLKVVRAQYNRTGEYKTTLKEPYPGVAYVELILRYDPDIEPHVPANSPWHHRGQAGWTKDGQAALRLTYRLVHPIIDDWMLEPLGHDIAGVIRHELEHNRQGPAVRYAKSPGEDWGNIDKTRSYLLDPREVEAVGTQMYLQAKREKVPITIPMERKLKQLTRALKRRGVEQAVIDSVVDDYRKALTDYVVKRYPGARFS